MKRILLLGANGQVGWELRRSLAPLGELIACTRNEADLANPEQLQRLVEGFKPNVIVNAAAYTAVDKAESDEATARQVNAESVGLLADLAAKHEAWLVHYSTDYVFDGLAARPYAETDATQPMSVYGRTKRDGEEAIAASGCQHLIFRTSWVYAARGNNFAKTMLRLASERDSLKVVADQVGAPTSAELIADVTALALYRLRYDSEFAERAGGLYHLAASGETSWHGYAAYVLDKAEQQGQIFNVTSAQVQPIKTTEYPTPAKRPLNSRLGLSKIEATFCLKMPHWRAHVDRLLIQIADGSLR